MFIHIPKNGGMTIRRNQALESKIILAEVENNYRTNLLNYMRKVQEGVPNVEHARWKDWKSNIRNTHQSFAIIRNPWSRVVSRYEYARKILYKENGKTNVDCSSLEAFLETRHLDSGLPYFWHRAIRSWYPQLDYVVDDNGVVKCDILRFENYDEDVKSYFGLFTNPRARNVTGYDKSKYKDYYNKNTIQIVADWYEKDINQWGFDFDTGATKKYWNDK